MCEDYRAGLGPDRAADDADRAAGRVIQAPLLVLWGTKLNIATGTGPDDQRLIHTACRTRTARPAAPALLLAAPAPAGPA